jgi:integration host factor subunit beta
VGMTRSDLIAKISKVYPCMSVKNVDTVISIIMDEIVSSLKLGNRVEIRGFGSFAVKRRSCHERKNMKTGEKIYVEEKNVPFFRAGKQLRDLINNNSAQIK